ncbi:MAG TPA: hypothetical protein VE291_03315, partial [Terracidiphilus sp.]|nr:hypothetical protein [Terracidiphilus sp.]
SSRSSFSTEFSGESPCFFWNGQRLLFGFTASSQASANKLIVGPLTYSPNPTSVLITRHYLSKLLIGAVYIRLDDYRSRSDKDLTALSRGGATGHGFSRAANRRFGCWALAPEGRFLDGR